MSSIFTLTEQQEMIRKTARDFLATECPKKLVREMEEDEQGYSPELWREIAALGWIGLGFPQQYGGAGLSFRDLVVLIEEMGRACLPSPYISTVIACMTILDIGTEEQKNDILSKANSGKPIITLALIEPNTVYKPTFIMTTAVKEGGNYVINGRKCSVPYAQVADMMICATRTNPSLPPENALTLFLVDSGDKGISRKLLDTVPKDKQYELVFNNVSVSQGNMLGVLNQGWPAIKKILQQATIAKCAEMIGGAQQVIDMSIGFCKERIQFGRPIGSFQAVHNRLVDMVIGLDGARYLTYYASEMLNGQSANDRYVAMAKAWTSNAYRQIALSGSIIHGGNSATLDHDMQLFFRHAKASELAFGDPDFHLMEIAKELSKDN